MFEQEKFKKGDKVIVYGSYSSVWLDEIVSVTKAGKLKVSSGTLFYPDGGQYGGNTWHRKNIRLATPELIKELKEKAERNKIINQMRSAPFSDMDIEDLRVIKAVVDKYSERREGKE